MIAKTYDEEGVTSGVKAQQNSKKSNGNLKTSIVEHPSIIA